MFILDFNNSRLDIKQNNKKIEKTVLFIKKPVEESLNEEFVIKK